MNRIGCCWLFVRVLLLLPSSPLPKRLAMTTTEQLLSKSSMSHNKERGDRFGESFGTRRYLIMQENF